VKRPKAAVETVVSKVDVQTGEILHESVPLEVDVPCATALMLKTQAQLPEIWRYRREGD